MRSELRFATSNQPRAFWCGLRPCTALLWLCFVHLGCAVGGPGQTLSDGDAVDGGLTVPAPYAPVTAGYTPIDGGLERIWWGAPPAVDAATEDGGPPPAVDAATEDGGPPPTTTVDPRRGDAAEPCGSDGGCAPDAAVPLPEPPCDGLGCPCDTSSDCTGARPVSMCEVVGCIEGRCELGWASPTTTCDDANACTEDDRCVSGGVCRGLLELDAYEPSHAASVAHYLGAIDDGAAFPAGELRASLHPEGDEDWYRYHVDDDLYTALYPRADLAHTPPGTVYEVCAFWRCDSAPSAVSCRAGHVATHGSLIGCCDARTDDVGARVRLDPGCAGIDDAGTVFLRVRHIAGEVTCDSYLLRWGDD